MSVKININILTFILVFLINLTSIRAQHINSQQDNIANFFSEGKNLYRQEKYTEAIAVWQKILVIDPDNSQAQRYIERAQTRLGENLPQPETASPAAAPGKEETIETHLSAGKNYYRQQDYLSAITSWQKVLEKDPDNAQAKRYIERARAQLEETAPGKKIPAEKKEPPTKPEQITIEMKRPSVTTTKPVTPDGLPIGILSLKQCIHKAIDNSLSLNVAKREIRLAKQKVKDARRALFPAASIKWEEINGTTTGEDFKGRELYLELQQPIYQGGRLINTWRQATMNMRVARKNYQKLKNDLVYEVEQAYHILSSTKKIYRELTELISYAGKDYQMAQQEYQLGLEREIDFLNVKNQYEDTEYKLLSNQKDLTLAYLTLYQTVNIDPQEQTIDIPEVGNPQQLNINVQQCEKIALEYRPDLEIKNLLLDFNKYGLQIAQAQNRLKIDLTGGAGYKDEVFITEDLNLQPEWYVGIKGSLPIWLHTLEESFVAQDKVPSAGQTTSTDFHSFTTSLKLFDNTGYTSISEAKVNLEKAKDDLEKLLKSVKFEVKQDFYEYEKATYQLGATQTKLQLGELELAIVTAHRDLNLASINDVLRTRIKLWESKSAYQQAIAGYYTAVAKLNKTIGITDYFDPAGKIETAPDYYLLPPKLDMSLAALGPEQNRQQPAEQTPAPGSQVKSKSPPLPSETTEPLRYETKKTYLQPKKLFTARKKKKPDNQPLPGKTEAALKSESRQQKAEQKLLTALAEQKTKQEKEQLRAKEKRQQEEEKRQQQLAREEQNQKKKTAQAEQQLLRRLEAAHPKQVREITRQREQQQSLQEENQRKLLAAKEKIFRAEQKLLTRLEKEFAVLKKKQAQEAEQQQKLVQKQEQDFLRQLEQETEQTARAENAKLAQLRQDLAQEKESAAGRQYLLAQSLAEKIAQEKEQELAWQKQAEEKAAKKKNLKYKKLTPQEKYQKAYDAAIAKQQQEQQKQKEKLQAEQARKQKEKQAAAQQEKHRQEEAERKKQQQLAEQRRQQEKTEQQEQRYLTRLIKQQNQQKAALEKQQQEKNRAESKYLAQLEKEYAAFKKHQLPKEPEQKGRAEPAKGEEQAAIVTPAEITAAPQPQLPGQKTEISAEYEDALKQAENMIKQLEEQQNDMAAKVSETEKKAQEEFRLYFERGKKYYDQGNYPEAIKEWYKAQAIDFDNTMIRDYINQAEDKLRKGKYKSSD